MWGNIKNSTVNANVNEEAATDKKLYAKRHVDHAINSSYFNLSSHSRSSVHTSSPTPSTQNSIPRKIWY